LQSTFGGQYRRRARRVQLGADDQCAWPRRADRVERGRRATQTLVDLEFRIEPESGEQYRRVAALQQRHVAADQNDSLDRTAGNQRGAAGLYREGDRVLVITGHPVLGRAPTRQVSADRRDIGH
jgi:hypothetical protein